jgi:uncharacterized protein YbaP (TraB family)
MRGILDSDNKACENKGMRLEILRKKTPFPTLLSLTLAFLLSVASLWTQANDDQGADRALFWSIHKSGQLAGYLLGTIHSEDPRVLDFSEDMLQKLRSNRVFAMELVPDLPTLARLGEYMYYPSGQSLESVTGSERFKVLVSALSVYNIPLDLVRQMKPWAVMMTLSTPPPKTGFFMDLSLSLRASGSGLKVVGLETLEQQLSFLEEMPMAMQMTLLDQAVTESSGVNEVHAEMVNAYLENNLLTLQSLTEEQLQAVGDEASDYFMALGIDARNVRMAKSLLIQLEDNTVFTAVGALHLPGEKGLINLLRRQGYEVDPVDTPFFEAMSTADE